MPCNSIGFQDALDFIDARSNYARGSIASPSSMTGGPELGLLRTRALLDELGSPDRDYPIVHIAGSKGKGSTAAVAAAIGRAAGYRAGLSTSPHLHSFRERIALDGLPISQSDFARIGAAVRIASEKLERDRPELGDVTAFEALTAMALLAFAETERELAVVEVGLGGTFDATNVVSPAVSVITRLDFEHTQILGETLEEIAENKAGIIKPGIPVVTTWQEPEAMRVIEQTAHSRNAPLLVAGRDFAWSGDWRDFRWSSNAHQIGDLHTRMPGNHQMENASLAIAAWETLGSIALAASDDAIRRGLDAASLPGRFERFDLDGRTWVLDGAHTPVAAEALADALLGEFGRPVGVIAGMLRDKHPEPFFAALATAVEHLIVTAPNNPRAIPAGELILTARAADSQTIASDDLETALVAARARFPEGLPIAITGSFTLVAEARERFGLALSDCE
jgi:dihydrofolate synthase/folylpolyglutamate synthase